MLDLLLTLALAVAAGWFFAKLKVPAGWMVGALVAVSILSATTSHGYMPLSARVIAQMCAGAFIACTVEKDDLKRLPHLGKPLTILLISFLLVNLAMGAVFHYVGGLDWLTAMCCAIPGGLSDVPLIAADMGANGSYVAVAQFFRSSIGMGVFPSIVLWRTRDEEGHVRQETQRRQASLGSGRTSDFILTVIVAALSGMLGRALHVPAGGLLFPLLGVMALKLLFNRAYLPLWSKRVAQVLSGAYIGCAVTMEVLLGLRYLVIPIVILIAAYAVQCFVLGAILKRTCGLTMRESMLMATPAGAADMALIASDLHISSPDVIVIHILRMIVVIVLFPQIIHLLTAGLL